MIALSTAGMSVLTCWPHIGVSGLCRQLVEANKTASFPAQQDLPQMYLVHCTSAHFDTSACRKAEQDESGHVFTRQDY